MSNKLTESGLSYAQSGVNIEAQSEFVNRIKQLVGGVSLPGVLAGIGGFGAMFELPLDRYRQPILVSGTDGVGTKLMLANMLCQHDTIGIDLVAMCVNDIVCHGADPLYFLDYLATAKLDIELAEPIIKGIVSGVSQAGCALVGGETAEMPGLYHGEDYDLAGFCVGAVDKANIIEPKRIQQGDVLLALGSSGPHSNGYSLIRRVVEVSGADLSEPFTDDQTLGEVLLTPTKIYVKALQSLWTQVEVHGLAHITGGGLTENVPRMLPDGYTAQIDQTTWQWPDIFHWLQEKGGIAETEMRSTFNLGVGMVIALAPQDVDQAVELLTESGEKAWVIGEVVQSQADGPSVIWRQG